jgi:protein SCO1/2
MDAHRIGESQLSIVVPAQGPDFRNRKLLLVACLVFASCRERPPVPAQRYEIKGKVVSVDKGRAQVTVAHEEIPGYMPAMTMPFSVKDAWAMSVLAPGQLVQAALVVQGNRSWLEEITITQAPSGGAVQGSNGAVQEPNPGDEIPDFQLTNQDGKRIHLGKFRGRALLLTFVYTRCPLPDYCPRMSNNFAEIYRAVKGDPRLLSKIHTISFDPEFDKPQVLRGYGTAYAGGTEAFKQWEFASGSPEDVKKIAMFFGLTYWQETGQIIHSLRTALIAPDGKLAQLYHGNDWRPRQVLAQLKRLIGP